MNNNFTYEQVLSNFHSDVKKSFIDSRRIPSREEDTILDIARDVYNAKYKHALHIDELNKYKS